MIIRLQQGNMATRWPCCVCGGQTEKDDVYAVAFHDDGTKIGHVCEECIEAGPAAMQRRAFAEVERMGTSAKLLEEMALTLDGVAVPATGEWAEARKRFQACIAADTDTCDLPDVHTPLTLPDGTEVPVRPSADCHGDCATISGTETATVTEETSDGCDFLYETGEEALSRENEARDHAKSLQTEFRRLGVENTLAAVSVFGRVQIVTHNGSLYELRAPESVLTRLAELQAPRDSATPPELRDLSAEVAFAVIPAATDWLANVSCSSGALEVHQSRNPLWEFFPGGAQPQYLYDIVHAPTGRFVCRFQDRQNAEQVAEKLYQRLPADAWRSTDADALRVAFKDADIPEWLAVQETLRNYGDCLPF